MIVGRIQITEDSSHNEFAANIGYDYNGTYNRDIK